MVKRTKPSVEARNKKHLPAPPWAVEAWQVFEYRGAGSSIVHGTFYDFEAAAVVADKLWDNNRRIKLNHVFGILNGDKFYRVHVHQTKVVGDAPHAETHMQLKASLDRINTAVAALPTFAIIHEGGIEAATQNVVDSILAAARKLEPAYATA
jgi:hypothetical protein